MEIVTMPQLGETVTEGTITRWFKQVGDHVDADESLFEVSTDKVDTEVPSVMAGWVRALLVAEGDTVAVGVPLAIVTESAEEPFEAPVAVPPRAPPAPPTQPADATPVPAREQRTPTTTRRPPPGAAPQVTTSSFLSPVVRRLLDEHGLAAEHVVGSGRDGRITRADVLAAATSTPARLDAAASSSGRADAAPTAPPPIAGPDDDVVEFTKARRTTAEHMIRSLHTSAHTLVVTQVDYDNVEPARRSSSLSYLPFVARAVIDALREHPHLNASVGDDELIVHRRIHLGVAVDVEHQALVVPVVHDADELRIGALAEAVSALAAKARAKRLSGEDLAGGTITITNVGRYGTVVTAPVINQPQVAIVSTDGVRMTPVAVATGTGEWAVAVHPVGNLSMSFDHRAVDGAYAASFLARVRELLETRDWTIEVTP
jgi:pyruvate dehydrogenase E2 component (dihydrolipoamide acetyltransferase)